MPTTDASTMRVASLLFSVCVFVSLGTFAHAWDEDKKCDGHDGQDVDRLRRVLLNGDWDVDAENQELAAVRSTIGKNSNKVKTSLLSEQIKNLRGSSQRKLGVEETVETFQLIMHWEDDYCWQLEAKERKWCMSCAGGTCGDDDLLWIQECNDALIQRFVWEPFDVPGRSNTGKLKPYLRQDLCLEFIGTDGTYSHFGVTNPRWWYFLLKPCDDGNLDSQILEGYNDDDPFEFLATNSSQPNPERLLSQAHDPRAGEIILGEYKSNARFDKTSLWETYDLNSDLPATPDVDSGGTFCAPAALMVADDPDTELVTSGNTIVNWDADTYVEQYDNGRFVVRRGFPDRPEQILFDNELDEREDDYFTKLRGNGDLLTFRGTPGNEKGDSVWKLDFDRPEGVFFLGVECDLGTVSLYEFVPEDPGDRLWTTEGTKWVPDGTTDPPLLDESEMPTITPSAEPSEAPSDKPSGAPSAFPSEKPSFPPSAFPSDKPSIPPSSQPSLADTETNIPASGSGVSDSSAAPSSVTADTSSPSAVESQAPTDVINAASESPTESPTEVVVAETENPSGTPSDEPSESPTNPPSEAPAVASISSPGVVAVSGSFCTPTSQCQQCYGDCDEDSDCQGDLICEERDGGDPVTSCSGGENSLSDTDYCVDPNWNINAQPDGSESASPSVSILESVAPSEAPAVLSTLGPSASLGAGGEADLPPLTVAGVEGCMPSTPCDKCVGDCDEDADCVGEFVCFQRSPDEMNQTVPGCSGYDRISVTDYCIDPSYL